MDEWRKSESSGGNGLETGGVALRAPTNSHPSSPSVLSDTLAALGRVPLDAVRAQRSHFWGPEWLQVELPNPYISFVLHAPVLESGPGWSGVGGGYPVGKRRQPGEGRAEMEE